MKGKYEVLAIIAIVATLFTIAVAAGRYMGYRDAQPIYGKCE